MCVCKIPNNLVKLYGFTIFILKQVLSCDSLVSYWWSTLYYLNFYHRKLNCCHWCYIILCQVMFACHSISLLLLRKFNIIYIYTIFMFVKNLSHCSLLLLFFLFFYFLQGRVKSKKYIYPCYDHIVQNCKEKRAWMRDKRYFCMILIPQKCLQKSLKILSVCYC